MNEGFKITSVFQKNNQALKDGYDLIINQGGTRSGKTYSILQLLFLKALYSKKELIISVVSRALPHLRLGAMRDFDNILISYGINPDKIKNKTESYYKVGNSIIEFFGADQSDKVHGPQRDILFLNEANFLKQEIYDQLTVRTSKTIFIEDVSARVTLGSSFIFIGLAQYPILLKSPSTILATFTTST